jgi:ketosteroid isomerase-like protein
MSQDVISQVRSAQREWIQAIREKNTSRLLDMVTKDILVIHPKLFEGLISSTALWIQPSGQPRSVEGYTVDDQELENSPTNAT